MTQEINGSRTTAARLAGWAIVLMAGIAGYAVYSTQGLLADTDGARTAANITSHEQLFRTGLCGWLMVAALDVLVAVALYIVFASTNRLVSLLSAVVRSVYAAILLAALGGLFDAVRQAHSGPSGVDQVVPSFHHFLDVWGAGLVLFGAHLALVGWLVWKSGFMPKAIGVLLWLASVGYVLGNVAKIVSPAMGAALDPVLAAPEAIGELALAVWLIARAKRLPSKHAQDVVNEENRIGRVEHLGNHANDAVRASPHPTTMTMTRIGIEKRVTRAAILGEYFGGLVCTLALYVSFFHYPFLHVFRRDFPVRMGIGWGVGSASLIAMFFVCKKNATLLRIYGITTKAFVVVSLAAMFFIVVLLAVGQLQTREKSYFEYCRNIVVFAFPVVLAYVLSRAIRARRGNEKRG